MPESMSSFQVSPSARRGMTLRVRGLRFSQRNTPIIQDIDCDCEHHGVTVIMGPNGAGKSVLLRLLHGLIPADQGSILWDDQPLGDQIRRQQAMVFQRPVLLRRSVHANLDFVVRHCCATRDVDIDGLLTDVGLDRVASRPARKLSGGEQQRLALARALLTQPRVLFLDEPSASLDPASTLIIERVVDECRRSGTKVFFVTHDVAQAHRIADNVLFLHHGALLEQASAKEFFRSPVSREALGYLNGEIVL